MDRLETKMNWGTPIPLYALPESVQPSRKALFSSQARNLGRKRTLPKCNSLLSKTRGFPSQIWGVKGMLLQHLVSFHRLNIPFSGALHTRLPE